MESHILLRRSPIRDALLGSVSIDTIKARILAHRMMLIRDCPDCGTHLVSFSSGGLAAPQSVLGPEGSMGAREYSVPPFHTLH